MAGGFVGGNETNNNTETSPCPLPEPVDYVRLLTVLIGAPFGILGIFTNGILIFLFMGSKYRSSPTLYLAFLAVLDVLICLMYVLIFPVDALAIYYKIEWLWVAWHKYSMALYAAGRIVHLASTFLVVCATLERFLITWKITHIPLGRWPSWNSIVRGFRLLQRRQPQRKGIDRKGGRDKQYQEQSHNNDLAVADTGQGHSKQRRQLSSNHCRISIEFLYSSFGRKLVIFTVFVIATGLRLSSFFEYSVVSTDCQAPFTTFGFIPNLILSYGYREIYNLYIMNAVQVFLPFILLLTCNILIFFKMRLNLRTRRIVHQPPKRRNSNRNSVNVLIMATSSPPLKPAGADSREKQPPLKAELTIINSNSNNNSRADQQSSPQKPMKNNTDSVSNNKRSAMDDGDHNAAKTTSYGAGQLSVSHKSAGSSDIGDERHPINNNSTTNPPLLVEESYYNNNAHSAGLTPPLNHAAGGIMECGEMDKHEMGDPQLPAINNNYNSSNGKGSSVQQGEHGKAPEAANWRHTLAVKATKTRLKAVTYTIVAMVTSYLICGSFDLTIKILENVAKDMLISSDRWLQFYRLSTDIISILFTVNSFLRLPIYLLCNRNVRVDFFNLFCSIHTVDFRGHPRRKRNDVSKMNNTALLSGFGGGDEHQHTAIHNSSNTAASAEQDDSGCQTRRQQHPGYYRGLRHIDDPTTVTSGCGATEINCSVDDDNPLEPTLPATTRTEKRISTVSSLSTADPDPINQPTEDRAHPRSSQQALNLPSDPDDQVETTLFAGDVDDAADFAFVSDPFHSNELNPGYDEAIIMGILGKPWDYPFSGRSNELKRPVAVVQPRIRRSYDDWTTAKQQQQQGGGQQQNGTTNMSGRAASIQYYYSVEQQRQQQQQQGQRRRREARSSFSSSKVKSYLSPRRLSERFEKLLNNSNSTRNNRSIGSSSSSTIVGRQKPKKRVSATPTLPAVSDEETTSLFPPLPPTPLTPKISAFFHASQCTDISKAKEESLENGVAAAAAVKTSREEKRCEYETEL